MFKNLSREDRLKEALIRLLTFKSRFRYHPQVDAVTDRINRLDGRLAAYTDETYPQPVRPSLATSEVFVEAMKAEFAKPVRPKAVWGSSLQR